MKTLLSLAAIIFLFLNITSCNDNETKTETASDSTKPDSASKLTPGPDTISLSKYEIDSATFEAMRKYSPILPKTAKKIDSSLKAEVARQYPTGTIYTFKAKYRQEDVDRYTMTRGFQPGSDSGKVKKFKTMIYKLVVPQDAKKPGPFANLIIYYDLVTLCPPPENSNCD